MQFSRNNEIRQYFPTEQLKPYIRYFIISEKKSQGEYKVLPSPGPVIGLQYQGQLSVVDNCIETSLNSAEITGISDHYRIFRSSANIGTILIYFSEVGFAHFTRQPANDLFNLSLSLDEVFTLESIRDMKEKLCLAVSDPQRISIVEQFLIFHLIDEPADKLIAEAAKIIVKTRGAIRMKNLAKTLFISQSPFEKRFRRIVGTSPKKFASIVRFNYIIGHLNSKKSLIELSFENGFYDQAHFSKEFKRYTGETPDNFKSLLSRKRSFTTAGTFDSASLQSDIQVKAVGTGQEDY